ncbi:MAG: LCP family protein [Patescibacteria group bacterium]|jgi:LCP family protein required for cell wall assembly
MIDHKSVNLLEPRTETPTPVAKESPTRRRRISPGAKLLFFGTSILLVGGFVLSAGLAKSSPYEDGAPLSILTTLANLVRSGEKPVIGEEQDRVNVLFLGVGGTGHDGAQLTDTMIFGSYRPSTKELGLISIPRDLNVFVPGYGYRKINAVNALAEQAKAGSGRDASAKTASTILGQPVPYTVKIDFGGFADVLDALGGIDVYVDRSFGDSTYPVDDELGSVKTISFEKGWMHMDGKTALEFARSRHGNNGEGSDFARAARQQKILLGLKDRALSMDVILNPGKLTRILSIIQKNVQTNMTPFEMIKFAKFVPDISTDRIALHVLDTVSGLLYETYINDAYVILPYEENWSDLHALALNIFARNAPGAKTPVAIGAPGDTQNALTVEIQNGTLKTGLAGDTAELLQSSGFTVALVTNADTRNIPNTTVYDFTNGAKDDELKALKDYLHAQVAMTKKGSLQSHAVIADSVIADKDLASMKKSAGTIDFLIVLGEDSSTIVLR